MPKKLLIKISLFIFIILQLLLVAYSIRKNIPFEIQSLLGPTNPVRIQYEKDLKTFNDDVTHWILVEKKTPFSIAELSEVSQQITRALEMNYGVEAIVSPTTAKYFTYDQQGFLLSPFLQDGAMNEMAKNELTSELWKQQLIHENFQSFLISFKTATFLPRKEEQSVFHHIEQSLKNITNHQKNVTTSILGTKVASAYFLDEMQLQQRVITPLLLLIIVLFFFFCFRSWEVIMWSLFTLFITYTSTLVLIIFVEGGLGPYSSFALMFSFIVATTDLIHFFGRYQQLSGPFEKRLQETRRIAWFPCLLTSLTTSAGFIALMINQNLPVRYFGLYCAFGCLMEWFAIFYILPIFLKSFGLKFQAPPFDSLKFSEILDRILKKYAKAIIATSALILAAGVYFTMGLKIDDNFYTKFEDKHPLSKTIENFSRTFDFAGSISVILKPKVTSSTIFNENLLKDFRRIEGTLEKHPDVSRVASLSHIYANLHRKTSQAINDESILNLLNNYGSLKDFYNERNGEYRITVFLRSLSTASLDSVLKQIDEISEKESSNYELRASGFSVIRSYINGKVIRDFFESFFLSAFLIFLCFLILYRSIKWSFLALIPNIIPLISVSGLMGLFKVPVDTNLVILICVAFGISGDNTLHLSYVIQQEQKKGKNYSESLRYAFKLIGIPMFATNAIFIVCLPVFLIGDLRLFDHIAIFLSVAFVFAFISDVFVFPALQTRFGWNLKIKKG